ncbi:MAG TPA: pyridoxamine 5'-phosphate oxidase [Thermoleophilaceae bacterium]
MTDPLRRTDLAPDPLTQFGAWFETARAAAIPEPEAMALASATPAGAPSLRMVLLKAYDERGFTFFTNYASRKGGELSDNPQAALLFHWQQLGRQLRIEGRVERVPRDETEAYARSRSRGSQLSALASPQSQPIPDRAWLEQRVAELADAAPQQLPVGESWGGFRVVPHRYEFWQHGSDRLHDRFLYRPAPTGVGWTLERLAP